MCDYDDVQRGNYFGGEPIRKIEIEEIVKNLKNGEDEVTEEMVKGGGDIVVDWIWKLCSMAFENGVVSKDLRSVVQG